MSTPILPLVIPLATSTTTLGLALFQYPVFVSFLRARPSIAGRPLSRYWNTFIRNWSWLLIAATAGTSAASGLFSAYRLRNSRFPALAAAGIWYATASACSLGHLAFGPFVAKTIKAMADGAESTYNDGQEADIDYQPKDWNVEQKIEETNMYQQNLWLQIHTVRMMTVDVAAVLFFFQGFRRVFGDRL